MKKLLLSTICIICSCICYAQVPYTTYTPVQVPRQGGSDLPTLRAPSLPTPPQYETIQAYFINRDGDFQRIKIKINDTNSGVYVRGYYDSTYNMWHDCNNKATAITSYSNDPQVIKNNFEWKCNILNIGNVYF